MFTFVLGPNLDFARIVERVQFCIVSDGCLDVSLSFPSMSLYLVNVIGSFLRSVWSMLFEAVLEMSALCCINGGIL